MGKYEIITQYGTLQARRIDQPLCGAPSRLTSIDPQVSIPMHACQEGVAWRCMVEAPMGGVWSSGGQTLFSMEKKERYPLVSCFGTDKTIVFYHGALANFPHLCVDLLRAHLANPDVSLQEAWEQYVQN